MNQTVTIRIYRPQIDIPGINGFFSIDGDTDFFPCTLIECDACEGAPGRWEYDPSVNSDETASAVVDYQ